MTSPATNSETEISGSRSTLSPGRPRKAFVPVHPTPCGKYTLIAKIGHGGMAEVYLAVSGGLAGFKKLAVVKRIHPQLLEEPEFVQMFLDEARLAARLNHPNVVHTHEVGEHDGVPFIAMEFMEGEAYDKVIKALSRRGVALPIKMAIRVAMEALAGLHYAHELKDFDGTPLDVVHRDISPSNIFIAHQGAVRILDFGIAKATTRLSETRTGQIKGKLSYMAPEQARGMDIDRRADVWSVGVTLFETCTGGMRLFRGHSDIDTLQRVLTGNVTDLIKEAKAELPPPLHDVIVKALARKPEDRYPTALAMRAALAEAMAQIEGPEPDVATLMAEHFTDVAESQRQLTGELVKNAEGLIDASFRESLPPDEHDIPITLDAGGEVETIVAHQPSQSRRMWLSVLMVVALGVGGAALVTLLESSDDAVTTTTDTGAAAAEPADTSAEEAPPAEPPAAEAQAAETEQAVAPVPATSEGTSVEAAAALEPLETAPARPRTRRVIRRARSTGADESPPSTASPEPDPRPAARAETGQLTLVTRPWSQVYLGSRSLGTTPLRELDLPAGEHTLRLVNAESSIDMRITVPIRAGHTTVRNLGLQ